MVFSAHGSQKGHILWFVYTTPFERMVLQKRHYSTFKSSGVSFVRMLWINWPWNRCSYFETHKATQIYVHSWLLKWLSATWETAIQTRKKNVYWLSLLSWKVVCTIECGVTGSSSLLKCTHLKLFSKMRKNSYKFRLQLFTVNYDKSYNQWIQLL